MRGSPLVEGLRGALGRRAEAPLRQAIYIGAAVYGAVAALAANASFLEAGIENSQLPCQEFASSASASAEELCRALKVSQVIIAAPAYLLASRQEEKRFGGVHHSLRANAGEKNPARRTRESLRESALGYCRAKPLNKYLSTFYNPGWAGCHTLSLSQQTATISTKQRLVID